MRSAFNYAPGIYYDSKMSDKTYPQPLERFVSLWRFISVKIAPHAGLAKDNRFSSVVFHDRFPAYTMHDFARCYTIKF